jgi:hypothetical protein
MTVQALKAGGFVTGRSSTAFSCRLIGTALHDINRASWPNCGASRPLPTSTLRRRDLP